MTGAPRRHVLGASALHAKRADAEHLLHELLRRVAEHPATGGAARLTGCTHLVGEPWRHEAVSVLVEAADGFPGAELVESLAEPAEIAVVLLDASAGTAAADVTAAAGAGLPPLWRHGAPRLLPAATEAATAHATGSGGRAVVFPGQDALPDEVTVTRLLAETGIDVVRSTHGRYAQDAVVVAGGFLRPQYSGGKLVLQVGHADPTRLMPWEVRNPTPCCGGDH
ncbi:hypothetical protein [Allostreptomyces psammosilenae]|uniref:Uncharacterized protein n=1 Tax=Allostreptomyces psammosilenae TaxID=1892865 RepID=A0A853A897_9ACTN|nr:hypothetical protein [Allostreptomyces psammosilenae]NYI06871.1 hypothetical protein [Allostreptomyces psammosilenae]